MLSKSAQAVFNTPPCTNTKPQRLVKKCHESLYCTQNATLNDTHHGQACSSGLISKTFIKCQTPCKANMIDKLLQVWLVKASAAGLLLIGSAGAQRQHWVDHLVVMVCCCKTAASRLARCNLLMTADQTQCCCWSRAPASSSEN